MSTAATACDNCSTAIVGAGMWHGYRIGCAECTARAAARSFAAFDAVRNGRPDDLRELIALALPATPYQVARDMVWRWWLIDHPHEQPRQP